MEKQDKIPERKENHRHKMPGLPPDDEKLQAAYEDTLGEILERDDEDARDNLSDYMDELREESENVGRPSGE